MYPFHIPIFQAYFELETKYSLASFFIMEKTKIQ